MSPGTASTGVVSLDSTHVQRCANPCLCPHPAERACLHCSDCFCSHSQDLGKQPFYWPLDEASGISLICVRAGGDIYGFGNEERTGPRGQQPGRGNMSKSRNWQQALIIV